MLYFLRGGRPGFDVGYEPGGACRGCNLASLITLQIIVANDNNFADATDVAIAA